MDGSPRRASPAPAEGGEEDESDANRPEKPSVGAERPNGAGDAPPSRVTGERQGDGDAEAQLMLGALNRINYGVIEVKER